MKEKIKAIYDEVRFYQGIYNGIVEDHSDDVTKHERIYKKVDFKDAIDYLENQSPIGIYPIKEYVINAIYAVSILEFYRVEITRSTYREFLALFQGESTNTCVHSLTRTDLFYLYDQIYEYLKEHPDFKEKGWVPYTRHYCWLECTKEGIDYTQDILVNGSLSQLDPDNCLIIP